MGKRGLVVKKNFRSMISVALIVAMTITMYTSVPFSFAEEGQEEPEVLTEEIQQEEEEEEAPEEEPVEEKKEEEPEEPAEEKEEQDKEPELTLNDITFPELKISAAPKLDPNDPEVGWDPWKNALSGKFQVVFKPVWTDENKYKELVDDGWTFTYALKDQNGKVLLDSVAETGSVYKVSKGNTKYQIVATVSKGDVKQEIKSDFRDKYIFIDPPSTVKVTCGKNTNYVHVKWSQVDKAAGYYVYRVTKKGSKPKKRPKYLSGADSTSYVDEMVPGKKTYYYYVAAVYREDVDEKTVEYRTCSASSAPKKITVNKFLNCKVRPIGWHTTIKSTCSLFKNKTGGATKGKVKKGTKVDVVEKYPAKVPYGSGPSRIRIKYKKNGKLVEGWVGYGRAKGGVLGTVAYKKKKAYDWPKDQKEAYVNNNDFSSPTKYLIWVSTYTQKVNIFKGKKGHWKLYKSKRCVTGTFLHLTKIGQGFSIWKHQKTRVRNFYHSTGQYYYHNLSYFSKGNSFHTVCWRVGNNKQVNFIKKNLQPGTRGCCRMYTPDATWIYNNIPMKTKVVVH